MDAAAQKRLSYVEAAEAAFADLGPDFDPTVLDTLRTVVSGYPDTGSPGPGEVSASLFMLLERLIADRRVDRDALELHLRAWRPLLSTEPDPEAAQVLIQGLKAIRDHSTQAKAA